MQREVRRGAPPASCRPPPSGDWGGYLQAELGLQDRPGAGPPASTRWAATRAIRPIRRSAAAPAPSRRPSPGTPTEYSKLRLQYNYDQLEGQDRDEHSLWLQLEFLMGAHAAHKF